MPLLHHRCTCTVQCILLGISAAAAARSSPRPAISQHTVVGLSIRLEQVAEPSVRRVPVPYSAACRQLSRERQRSARVRGSRPSNPLVSAIPVQWSAVVAAAKLRVKKEILFTVILPPSTCRQHGPPRSTPRSFRLLASSRWVVSENGGVAAAINFLSSNPRVYTCIKLSHAPHAILQGGASNFYSRPSSAMG